MLFHPYPNAFGLDIGDLSIKIVQLDNTTGHKRIPSFRLKALRQITLPPGLIVNGEIQEPEKVRTYLQHLISGKGEKKGAKPLGGKWVVGSLPEIHSFIKVIHLEKEARDVLDDDIVTLAKQHIPFDEEMYYLDWQILPPISEGNTRILIGAAPKYIVDMYTYLIESLGLSILSLEIEALAIARSLPQTNFMQVKPELFSMLVQHKVALSSMTTKPFNLAKRYLFQGNCSQQQSCKD